MNTNSDLLNRDFNPQADVLSKDGFPRHSKHSCNQFHPIEIQWACLPDVLTAMRSITRTLAFMRSTALGSQFPVPAIADQLHQVTPSSALYRLRPFQSPSTLPLVTDDGEIVLWKSGLTIFNKLQLHLWFPLVPHAPPAVGQDGWLEP